MGEGSTEEFKTESCGNCHALLVGDYCHHCGQQNRVYVRSVFSLVGDFLHDIANWDSRIMRTLVPLMFRPGFLSNEYVAGHRARYVPPVRLYVFISILFFLALASVAHIDTDSPAWQWAAPPAATVDADGRIVPPEKFSERYPVEFNLPFVSDATNAELVTRIDRLAERPDVLVRQIKTLAPQMMFLLLPLFALILKVLYLFAKRYYVEHLILALHTHSFMFLSFLVLIGAGALRGWTEAGPVGQWVGVGAGLLTAAIWIWIPVYLFIAQHRFYGQHWLLTIIKYMLTAIIYFTMLIFALTALVLVSIATA